MWVIYILIGLIIGLWVGGLIGYFVSEKKRMQAEDTAQAYKQNYNFLKKQIKKEKE